MLTKQQLRNFEQQLIALRAVLEKLSTQTKGDRAAVELDQSKVGRLSRMDALQGQAMAVEAERRRGLELQRIAAALKRIESDSFGYCLSCDEEIALKRLENNPAVPTCIDCAQG